MSQTHNDASKALSGFRVVDLGVGMGAALAVRILADAGADVTRFEPSDGDPFYEVYPAYRFWRRGFEIQTSTDDAIYDAARVADVVVLGGEDYPGLTQSFDPAKFRALSDRIVVLSITGSPPDWREPALPATEVLAQARSGFIFEHYADRPLFYALPIASYGVALHGANAVIAALLAREEHGRGDLVATSMLQGAARWAAPLWGPVERPPPSYNTMAPKGAAPCRFRCADGLYVHLAPAVAGGYDRLYALLGITEPNRKKDGDPKTHFGDYDTIAPHVATWTRADILRALAEQDIPADAVLEAGEPWDEPQTAANGVLVKDDRNWQGIGFPARIAAEPASETLPRSEAGSGPLAGVRVVDLGSFAAGPHASVILGDLGADVIKVERFTGDPLRRLFHHYCASSRGKRSIAIDAKAEEGAGIIQRICDTANAVHHNFRPGVSARLGVDRETLKRTNPSIVVLESSAYGATGPKADLPGFDTVFQAACGHEPRAAGEGHPPLSYRFTPMDYSTGVIGGLSMLLGLMLQKRFGMGANALACLYSSGLFMLNELVRSPAGEFTGAPSNNDAQTGFHPAEALYRTRDGWIAIAARNDDMARDLANVLGIEGALARSRDAWSAPESKAIADAFAEMTSAAAIAALQRARVWVVACPESVDAFFADPQTRDWGLVLDTQSPEWGLTSQVGYAVQFADNVVARDGRGLVDARGGHSREILSECGYSDAEIEGFFARGVVA